MDHHQHPSIASKTGCQFRNTSFTNSSTWWWTNKDIKSTSRHAFMLFGVYAGIILKTCGTRTCSIQKSMLHLYRYIYIYMCVCKAWTFCWIYRLVNKTHGESLMSNKHPVYAWWILVATPSCTCQVEAFGRFLGEHAGTPWSRQYWAPS